MVDVRNQTIGESGAAVTVAPTPKASRWYRIKRSILLSQPMLWLSVPGYRLYCAQRQMVMKEVFGNEAMFQPEKHGGQWSNDDPA